MESRGVSAGAPSETAGEASLHKPAEGAGAEAELALWEEMVVRGWGGGRRGRGGHGLRPGLHPSLFILGCHLLALGCLEAQGPGSCYCP